VAHGGDREVLEDDPRLEVGDRAVVRGGGYRAVALGTSTLLQALSDSRPPAGSAVAGAPPGGLALPRGTVDDAPRYRFRAIQMCVKHQVHDISMIEQGVDLCRMYKLNVLALHLRVFCWWGDGRAYRYTVEASPDGDRWSPLVDRRANAKPSGPEGTTHRFETAAIKALRIHVHGNTVNDHGHLSEVRAYEVETGR
jgi:hypothetical protein